MRRRARLPGPPAPTGPPALLAAIDEWDGLLRSGLAAKDCRPLLNSVQGPKGRAASRDTGGPPYVSLYKGIAEGCLGQLQAARRDLGAARRVGLGPDETSKDTTCNAQLLLVFGFDAFLDEQASPVCPPPVTTTRAPTSTTTASTTLASTTSTR